MSIPALPANQTDFADDLAAVARIDAVTTMLEVICRTTGMGFAAVARVTDTRWVACAVRDEIAFGLMPGGELDVGTTICNEIRRSGKLVAIDDVTKDALYFNHPTPKMYGLESYISMPIILKDGRFFGTLCAIDPRPASVTSAGITGMFKLFAELIAFHLDANERLLQTEEQLTAERANSVLREQFIAVLGHDLRNPLASIDAGAAALALMPLDSNAGPIVGMIQRSATRMSGLISNVLDFARGRLGGGISVSLLPDNELHDVLQHVVDELQAAYAYRLIETEFALNYPVHADSARIAQLFSNLLANALAHGDPSAPVSVRARSDVTGFELSVGNGGIPIPSDTIERLFQPFSRATARRGKQGLGLGLYIASEIARAHNGVLEATSTKAETRFTFRIPS